MDIMESRSRVGFTRARAIDNIIRPSQWTANGQASLLETASDDTLEAKLGGGGDGRYDPGMDKRVATLEADMRGMTGSLNRVEMTLAVVAEGMKALATKVAIVAVTNSVNTLSANVTALDSRVVTVETAITDTVKTALAKSIGPVQAVGMLAGAIGVLVAAASAVNWLVAHGYFPHSP